MLTAEEIDAVKKLQTRLQDLKLDVDKTAPLYMIRWLKARDKDVLLAEEMFRKYLEWRDSENVDHIFEWSPSELLTSYGQLIHRCGIDKTGNEVFMITCDLSHLKEILCLPTNEIKKACIYFLETIEILAVKSQQHEISLHSPTRQCIIIADLSRLSAWQVRKLVNGRCWELNLLLLNLLNSNYPELPNQIVVINAPRIFTILFALIKPFLPARTVEKFKIFGYNKSEWARCLLDSIDDNQLFTKLGGTSEVSPSRLFEHLVKDFDSNPANNLLTPVAW